MNNLAGVLAVKYGSRTASNWILKASPRFVQQLPKEIGGVNNKLERKSIV